MQVQLVGDRRHTRVEERVLHLDVAASAIKLVQKGSVRVFLRFDVINQVVFDEVCALAAAATAAAAAARAQPFLRARARACTFLCGACARSHNQHTTRPPNHQNNN